MVERNDDQAIVRTDKNRPVSQGDLLGITDQPTQGSPLLRVADVSQKIQEWAAMGRHTPEQRLAMVAVFTEDMALNEGRIDSGVIMWMNNAMQIGDDGEGRKEYLRAMGAGVDREDVLKGGGLISRMFRKRGPESTGAFKSD